ncbi:MAG: hypothetical protein KatS3mg105_0076 [Gemmatales bacterium]|nr:MAG: hypothetical protein KatS3mg105_0076 [Gemmatales bacterium]
MRNVIVRHLRNKRASRGQHPGLLLQRYLCEKAAGDDGNPEEKKAILLAAINAATNPEVRQLYDAAYERWKSSLLSTAQTTIVKTLGRLIVGLGSENVTETGITLHHTFGMPVIPGSALKGLAAHYCHQVWGEQDDRFRMATEKEDEAYRKYLAGKRPQPEKDNFHRLLFGNTDDSGCILFHDAWYVPGSDPQPLRRDVMTPHHKDWLDGRKPPTDFDSPTPVSFLSVRGSFLIALSWCGPDTPAARDWTGKNHPTPD